MTDPNVAQAAVLIAALNEQLRAMAPKLRTAERQADSRHAAGARAMREIAAGLRRDINHAQFLIARPRSPTPPSAGPDGHAPDGPATTRVGSSLADRRGYTWHCPVRGVSVLLAGRFRF
ncbi:hypothetical protein [Mycolicibacterium sp.]|uniref:hypothetical protein n=1 Tax=Mycolicibacterium sp. TaxID=2320850 RepID=UPI0037C909DB